MARQDHGKHGSGAGCQELAVNVTERLVAKEWNKVPQETYNAKPRRVAWVDASRHVDETDDESVRGNLKQGVFPSMIVTYALIQMVGTVANESGKVDIITNRSCDGVDCE